MSRAFVFAVLLSSLAGCGGTPASSVTVIVGAALVEGNSVLHVRSAIVVDGAHIRAAGSQGDVPIPAGSEKLDATGLFAVAAGSNPVGAGEPADIDFLACSPIDEPACRRRVERSMRRGEWVQPRSVEQ